MPLALVGNPAIRRRDTLRKVTGQAVYTFDINPSHIGEQSFIYMGKVTCPYPHANITKIDVSKAEAAGYVTVSAQDMSPFTFFGVGGRAHTPLPRDTVRYAGEPVVCVGAPTTNEVEDAIDLVDVEFEPLPFVLDAEEALQSGAPRIWPDGNVPAGGFNPEPLPHRGS